MDKPSFEGSVMGRSRWSKALPAPPAPKPDVIRIYEPLQNPSPLISTTKKPLPSFDRPLPPPKEVAMDKPVDSPLPALPQTPAGASSARSIPRRPVAPVTNLPSPGSEPSPLSSLLSAYSNRYSDDSTLRSSTDGTQLSSAAVSPGPEFSHNQSKNNEAYPTPPLSSFAKENDVHSYEYNASRKPAAYEPAVRKQSPPLQAADREAQRPTTPPAGRVGQDYPAESPQATRELTPSSPSRPQIWSRRSNKAERNVAVSELKLVTSHGSTASSAPVPVAQSPATEQKSLAPPVQSASQPESSSPSATTRPLPRSPNAGLPGKNIRPAASREPLATQNAESVAQEASQLRQNLRKASNPRIESEAPLGTGPIEPQHTKKPSTTVTVPSPVARLPTPDYAEDDVKGPIHNHVISPVSPVSSPEPPVEPKRESVTRVGGAVARFEANRVRPAKSTPSLSPTKESNKLAPKPSLPKLAVRPPFGLPSSPAATRGLSPEQTRFPARTSSRQSADLNPPVARIVEREIAEEPAAAQILPEETAPSAEVPKPLEADSAVNSAESAQDTTLVEADEEATGNNPAELFPYWSNPIPEGTIFDAAPISARNLKCLIGHRHMHKCRNFMYPLACATCGVRDTADRYTCSSCWLRTCERCANSLFKLRGDLQVLLEHNQEILVESAEETGHDDGMQDVATPVSGDEMGAPLPPPAHQATSEMIAA